MGSIRTGKDFLHNISIDLRRSRRFGVFIAAGLGGLLLALILLAWMGPLPVARLLGLVGLGLALWGGFRLAAARRAHSRTVRALQAAEQQTVEAYRRLDIILEANQKFVEAGSESEVIELLIHLALSLTGAGGASFVPLDARGQPLAAVSRGEIPFPVMHDWVEYLAAPAVRERCKTCKLKNHNTINTTCPLLEGPVSEAVGMFCLPLRRGEEEFGILNLYMPDTSSIDEKLFPILQTLMDETALTLEGIRLRGQEMAVFHQNHTVREKSDLSPIWKVLVENVRAALEADFAVLALRKKSGRLEKVAAGGGRSLPEKTVSRLFQGVSADGGLPLFSPDEQSASSYCPGLRSLMAVPLAAPGQAPDGVLLVGNWTGPGLSKRGLPLLQIVAGQAALIRQNANHLAEAETQSILEERTRIAREIHDGLAQTLGFLKLHTAQMRGYLENQDLKRLRKSLDLSYTTLSELYHDARQAIDGLRIEPSENGLFDWLEQTAADFEEISGLPVTVEGHPIKNSIPPEVHAQLIRIVQEALSNVRKHARAARVWISYREMDQDFWLEVRDDGGGFLSEDVPSPSQHGLRGMRERAELIGADFQVISRPGEGTSVRVRLPLCGISNHNLEESRP